MKNKTLEIFYEIGTLEQNRREELQITIVCLCVCVDYISTFCVIFHQTVHNRVQNIKINSKMDFVNVLSKSDPHQRTIIHLDMDCFYAQVEEIRDPKLRELPLGIQQKNIVVTCNYVARKFGLKKLMLVAEAKRLCPNLVLVNGEDLTPYRQMSQRIFELCLNYTPIVEKLGLDETFLDVTALVEQRQRQRLFDNMNGKEALDERMVGPDIEGYIYPLDSSLNNCSCGCAQRLAIGTQIAKEIRKDLFTQLNVTCCAGTSYNKLLAKLVGAQNKPNQQTVLVSTHAEQFMRELRDLNRITGIGQKTESLLLESGIANVEELQGGEMDFLRKKFGFETATKLRDLSFGRDPSSVRPTGKPKSISLEDSCRPISVRTEVEERFRLLLMRLIEQVAEDGRIPVSIKVVLRKFDPQKKTSHRETKQANVQPSLFKSTACTDSGAAKVILANGAQEKLLKIIMRLFERVIDMNKPFNITLLGLAFSKFQQRRTGPSSIANFLIKKTDLEVQSITSLTNTSVAASSTSDSPTPSVSSTNSDDGFRSSPTTFQPSDQFYRRRTTAASPIPMLTDNGSESAATNSDFSDFSETEVEPSPKKSRISRLLVPKRRCFGSSAVYHSDISDVASPSKLRVCDLRLNSRDSEKEFSINNVTTVPSPLSCTSPNLPNLTTQPISINRLRTVQPPSTLLNRADRLEHNIGGSITRTRQFSSSSDGSPLPSPMDGLPMDVSSCTPTKTLPESTYSTPNTEIHSGDSSTAKPSSTSPSTTTTITGNLSNIPCPAGVDPQVFNELPFEVQNELITSWRSSLAAAAVAVANANAQVNVSPLTSVTGVGAQASAKATAATKAGGVATNGTQKNTLYRYFLRNK